MSTIDNQQDVYAALGLTTHQQNSGPQNDATEMGMNTFLKLMVTQMNNQDPMKPMENGDFLGQIAQFASVTGLDKVNTQIADLSASLTSGQALQAGSLIGRQVLVPINVGRLEAGKSIDGQVDLDAASSEVTLRVYDPAGQLVREVPLGAAESGTLKFNWDGTNDDGNYAEPGWYQFKVSAKYSEGDEDQYIQLIDDVESVNVSGTQGLTLNLEGLGPVSYNNISQIF
jgi:flagellar basal-body rod modification protein FlgD